MASWVSCLPPLSTIRSLDKCDNPGDNSDLRQVSREYLEIGDIIEWEEREDKVWILLPFTFSIIVYLRLKYHLVKIYLVLVTHSLLISSYLIVNGLIEELSQ